MDLLRKVMKTTVAVAAVALIGISHAEKPPSKGEQALKYRKSVYQTIAWNFGPLAAMVQGKVPFDTKDFAVRADRVAFLVPLLQEAYGPETRDVAGSKLKPLMWDQRADFDHRLDVAIQRSQELAKTARTGDVAKSKAAFVATADACKACHEQYRSD